MKSIKGDEVRRVVTEKLTGIKPVIAPTSYRLEFYKILDGGKPVPDLYVVELIVPKVTTRDLYFTNRDEAWVKTDAGKKKLTGPEMQQEIIKRVS